MAKFQIPQRVVPGFEALLKIENEEVDKIGKVLKEIPAGTGPNTFHDIIIDKLDSIRDVLELGRMVYSFGNLLINSEGESLKNLADELADSFNKVSDKKLSSEQVGILSSRLEIILNNSSNLKLTYKAIDLLNENDQIFIESRIITDIRFIFNDKLVDEDRHAAVFHNLKIEYKKDNKDVAFFVSLDSEDLVELKKQIERALEKEVVIRESYKNSITFLNIGD